MATLLAESACRNAPMATRRWQHADSVMPMADVDGAMVDGARGDGAMVDGACGDGAWAFASRRGAHRRCARVARMSDTDDAALRGACGTSRRTLLEWEGRRDAVTYVGGSGTGMQRAWIVRGSLAGEVGAFGAWVWLWIVSAVEHVRTRDDRTGCCGRAPTALASCREPRACCTVMPLREISDLPLP
jgi:hypothetical protein